MTVRSVPLGEVAELRSGVGFPKRFQGRASGDFPFAKVGDISAVARSGSRSLETATNYVMAADLVPLKAKPFPSGTIAFAKIGEAIRQNFRAVAQVPILLDNNVMGAIPGDEADPDYLFHFLASLDLYRFAQATTVPSLRKSELAQIAMPLPPLEEQRRLAAVLDAAEALRAKRRQALAMLDTLTRSVFHDLLGDPIRNEHDWPTVRLGDVAQFVRGITFKPKDLVGAGEPGSVVCLRTKNVQAEVDLDDLIAVGSAFVKRQEQYLQTGDVLVSSANSWNLVGKCCWVPELPWIASFGGFVTALRPTAESVHRRYLFEWFRHQRVQQLLRSFGRKTTNISNLNLDRCRSLALPLPPVESQRQFVDAVERIEHHRASLEASSVTLDTLFASLQQRAFRGEL